MNFIFGMRQIVIDVPSGQPMDHFFPMNMMLPSSLTVRFRWMEKILSRSTEGSRGLRLPFP
jgi:hypothetical protein